MTQKTRTRDFQRLMRLLKSALMITVCGAWTCGQADPEDHGEDKGFDAQLRERVRHVVVIYQENWSFDSLYGQFPGVNGLQNGFDTLPQLDQTSGYANYIYV